MLGRGRPGKSPAILGVRELTREEVLNTPRGREPTVKKLRDSHHMVARLLAMGHRPGKVAEMVGYSLVRVSTLQADPSVQELIASYRATVDERFIAETDEYFETVSRNRTIAARLINDKLTDADPDDISLRELVTIHADAADRTGYPKRSVAVNVNVDFAAKLDQAIKRSAKARPELKVIEGTALHEEAGQMGAVGMSQHLHAAPLRPAILTGTGDGGGPAASKGKIADQSTPGSQPEPIRRRL